MYCIIADVRLCDEPALNLPVQPIQGKYAVGEKVSLFCLDGYKASGDLSITCQSDFNWTVPAGSCQRK